VSIALSDVGLVVLSKNAEKAAFAGFWKHLATKCAPISACR
jgi:hypothetical protein